MIRPVRAFIGLWRWRGARLAVAAGVLALLLADRGARLDRLWLGALPAPDWAGEVRYLRERGRYAEAIGVADLALGAAPTGTPAEPPTDEERMAEALRPATSPELAELVRAERALAVEARDSLLRRVRDAGIGALTGRADSLESLAGAVTADLFVVGDVRDLAIQGARLAIDGETDEVLLGLSALGVATTLAPGADWAPAVLKAARRAGHLTADLGEWLARTVRAGRHDELHGFVTRLGALIRGAGPGPAVRMLRVARSPDDVARLAAFAGRRAGAAAGAIHVTGDAGMQALRAGGTGVRAERRAEAAVVLAAGRGPAGVTLLESGRWGRLLRPHLLLGLAKAAWKGHATDGLRRLLGALDPAAAWLIPALCAWIAVELAGAGWQVLTRPPPGPPAPAGGPRPAGAG